MRFLMERLMLLIITLFGMLLVVFLLLHLAPGDPVELLIDIQVQYAPQEQLELIRKDLGLDQPLYTQLLRYLGRVVRGDLGYSYRTKSPIIHDIRLNVLPTVQLAIAGMCVALLIGVPSGIISALRRNTLVDYVTLTFTMFGLSAPNFFLGILLLYFFSFRLRWFPIMGDGSGGLGSTLAHLALPVLVVGGGVAALFARLTRSAMLEVMSQDHVRTAHAKGLARVTVVLKHVLRNAAAPVVAAAGTMFALLLTGSVVVEVVFARHGLGWLMIGAINNRDFPMVQGLILVFGTAIVLVNLATDVLSGLLDPTVSYK